MNRDGHSPVWLIPVLTGTTFFYFLLFAQFGYLQALAEANMDPNRRELVLLVMGLGGIGGSIFAAARYSLRRAIGFLLAGYACMATVAVAASLVTGFIVQIMIGFLIGSSLGIVTVTIVPLVRILSGGKRVAGYVSIGVGLAYFTCNLPPVFNASPWSKGVLSAVACWVGILTILLFADFSITNRENTKRDQPTPAHLFRTSGILLSTALFTGLIWYDSAAFYLIQETELLRAQTWTTNAQLIVNATAHLLTALLAGWFLDRGRLVTVLTTSIVTLYLGFSMINSTRDLAGLATILYISGVSAYSVALVAYGALAPDGKGCWSIAKRSGIVFAVGGWMGSGLGIGMAMDLQSIPIAFMVIWSGIFAGGLVLHSRLMKLNPGEYG